MTDDEWIALAALAGAEIWGSDNCWFLSLKTEGLHPLERERARTHNKAYFPSHAEAARAYCEWLERGAK